MLKEIYKKHPNLFFYSPLAIFLLAVYLKYIFQGGFIIDDWGVIFQAHISKTFWQNYTSWFPLFSNRPLAPLVLTVLSRIFGAWPFPYILTNLFFLFFAALLTSWVIEKQANRLFSVLFIIFVMMPVFSSVLVFSTAMQITATSSFFLWALSFYLQDKYLREGKKRGFYFSYFLVLAAFLIYEIILPLLALSFLYPIFIDYFERKEKLTMRKIAKYILPIILILVLIVLYQKVIMPHFMQVFSRASLGFSAVPFSMVIGKWLKSIFFDFPILLLSSIAYYKFSLFSHLDSWLFFLMLAFLFVFRKKLISENNKLFAKKDIVLGGIFLLIFFATVSLFVLSDRLAEISGYENRGMSASWFALSLLFAFIGSKISAKKFGFIVTGLASTVIFLSFVAQRDNYILSYRLQQGIIEDVATTYRNTNPQSEMTGKIRVLGNVPHFTPKNFNGEEVFNNFWDFGYAVNLKSGGLITGGCPLTVDKAKSGGTKVENHILAIGSDCATQTENLWYYEYNPTLKGSKLIKIENEEGLLDIINGLKSCQPDPADASYFGTLKIYFENQGVINGFIKYARSQ